MSYKIETKPFDVFYTSNMEEYNEFKTNATAGFNYLTKKLNTKPITSAIAMNEFIAFDDMDIDTRYHRQPRDLQAPIWQA